MSHARAMLESLNPATETVLDAVPIATPEEVQAAVTTARAAQAAWARTPVRERARAVRRVLRSLVDQREDIARRLSAEVGKPRFEAMMHEVAGLLLIGRYYAAEAENMLAPRPLPLGIARHRASYVHHAPLGVTALIAPFNFPFVIAGGSTLANLLAGNAVVLKPSELTPLSAEILRKLVLDAGIDGALFQVVHGRGDIGAALIEAQPDHVELTGSIPTGRRVAARCGELLIPCTLELGGKAAALVLPDADPERVAEALTWGAYANCGQVCASVERALVHTSVYEAVQERIRAKVRALRVGDPAGGDVDMGPMVSAAQRAKVIALVKQAVDAGARVLEGGAIPDGPGFFHQPTLLADVRPDMDIATREIFGPVLPLIPMSDVDAMIAESNRVRAGLVGYVFSEHAGRARAVAESLRCGTVMVNDVLATYAMPETPWAGLQDAGIGRSHGPDWLRELSESRHVNVPALPSLARDPWWFPYGPQQERTLGRTLRLLRPSKLRG